MKSATATILMLLLLPLASLEAKTVTTDIQKPLEPFEAIQLAAADPVNGVTGQFELTIRGSGSDRAHVYFNSERDYRDQRCLTLRMTRGNAVALIEALGLQNRDELIGRRIRVEGTAKRERVDFTSGKRRTGLYYYQTHVYVDDPSKVRLVETGS
ncbi:hypothetical protein M2650_01095 [Luteimonas sp. SX5]|uniref:Uncharacterized protein n=1 Tax=Luteimonas galliterrae TaxID=2940486 RepID=A0ABT0MEF2_9GAMM|nr:hypothetical protein [Luteimonas galliterrae]MCL1633246.1 hypothetical protein [Luteimonas galliterrae]